MNSQEIVHLQGSSWVIPGPTNIGLYERNNEVHLIDSGNDKESGRKINKIIKENNWKLAGIINTHSNADHIGGNDYLQRMSNCKIWSSKKEKAFIESPEIEASFLWGGFPVKELKNKFFEAKPSLVTDTITEHNITDELEVIQLPGHFFGMIGILTKDKVCYLGDCMFGENILNKHKIPYIYDVAEYKSSIARARDVDANYYVLSHGDIRTDIKDLADINLSRTMEIEKKIMEILGTKKTFESVLKELCDSFEVNLDPAQYALIGNTTKSFLSYLYHENRIIYTFQDNTMYWVAQE